MIKDKGDHLFIPIATKWLASGTDYDDDRMALILLIFSMH